MDLEGIMLSEIQKKTNTVNVTYMWNLKNKTSDCNKEETDSEIQRTNQQLPVGREKRGGKDRDRGLKGINYYV